MSGIKWDNIIIGTTMIGNRIVIGKLSKDKMIFTDKSSDRTNMAITAVCRHMKTEFKNEKMNDKTITNLEFVFEDGSKLVYMPNKEEAVE